MRVREGFCTCVVACGGSGKGFVNGGREKVVVCGVVA